MYFGAPLDDDLVGHWLMDENGGTSVASRIGAHDGSFVNSPTLIPNGGILDGAVSFDQPQEDVISIPDYDDTDTGDKLTVSYWINPDTLIVNAGHILKWTDASWDGDNSWAIRANPAGDEVYVFIAAPNPGSGDNYFSTSGLDLAAGTWTNVTFVYDGAGATDADRLKVYKNGAQVNGTFIGTIPTSLNNTSDPITLGRQVTELDAFGDFLDGRMDDVGFNSRWCRKRWGNQQIGSAALYVLRQNFRRAIAGENPLVRLCFFVRRGRLSHAFGQYSVSRCFAATHKVAPPRPRWLCIGVL